MKNRRDRIIDRVKRLEAALATKGRFRETLSLLAGDKQYFKRKLEKGKRVTLELHVDFHKSGSVLETKFVLDDHENGCVILAFDPANGRYEVRNELRSPSRMFGKFLHKFGLTKRVEGYRGLEKGEEVKARERLVDYYLEKSES